MTPKHLLTVLLVLLSLSGHAHSPMYPDSFDFDPSNEGPRPTHNLANSLGRAQAERLCSNGFADSYPCRNVHLQAFVDKSAMGGNGSNLNDIWGWSDLVNGREIAIVGRTNGTSFIDVTDPINPSYVGFLPSHNGGTASWRDIKVYANHAFIVADGQTNASHGLQVFDLTQLQSATPGTTFSETAHLNTFGAAHNIAINEDTGFAYVVGASQCSGGLYMVDISTPDQPSFAGCFSADGYTHDVQCVIYNGPDTQYFGQEICIAYNEDTITIVNVENKNNPQQISRTTYNSARYTHQGWFLDETHTYLVMNDELDETNLNINTTSYLYDVSSLANPVETGRYVGLTNAIDHNLYTLGGYVFESNYRAGLRILDASDIATGELAEVAYFDTVPCSNAPQFSGTWSSYIYFPSGNIVTTDIGTGLFVLRPDWNAINDPNNPRDVLGSSQASPICNPNANSGGGGGGGGGGWIGLWPLLVLSLIVIGQRRAARA